MKVQCSSSELKKQKKQKSHSLAGHDAIWVALSITAQRCGNSGDIRLKQEGNNMEMVRYYHLITKVMSSLFSPVFPQPPVTHSRWLPLPQPTSLGVFSLILSLDLTT